MPFNFESTWSGALLLGLLVHICDLSIWKVEAGRPQTKSILAYMASWRPAWVIWDLVSEKQKQKKQYKKQVTEFLQIGDFSLVIFLVV